MTSQTPNCTKVNTQNLSDRAHQITDITPKEKKENVEKVYISYTQLHKIVCRTSERIKKEFDPEVIVAIAGGGLVPKECSELTYKFQSIQLVLHCMMQKINLVER